MQRIAMGLMALMLGVVAFAIPAFGDETEPLPDGAAVMDRFTEVTGGMDAYDRINNRVAEATFAMPAQGIEIDFTVYSAKPNMNYLIGESETLGKFEQGCDGENVWEVSTMNGARFMEGVERADALRNAVFDGTAYWRDVFETVETVGVETIGETACYKVVATPSEGSPQTMYFDQDSGLLVQVESTQHTPQGELEVVSRISDYQDVDGIKIPFQTVSTVMGMERLLTLKSVEHNVELADDRFAVPEEVQEIMEIPEATRAD